MGNSSWMPYIAIRQNCNFCEIYFLLAESSDVIKRHLLNERHLMLLIEIWKRGNVVTYLHEMGKRIVTEES